MAHVKKSHSRFSRFYDGTAVTSRSIDQLLPQILMKIGQSYHQKGAILISSWPDIIGPKLAPMTQAISFNDGILLVTVTNSTLYSLLSQTEKPRILKVLREKFPEIQIKTIYFRIG